MLNEENLISTLEQSLRQTRNAQNRLLARLREVEGEAEVLRTEIDALQNSAEKTEEAIDSLFSTMRTGNKTWKTNKKPFYPEEDAYELPPEPRRYTRNSPVLNNNQQNHNAQQNNNQQNYN
jgi:chromosome segregation ATPase